MWAVSILNFKNGVQKNDSKKRSGNLIYDSEHQLCGIKISSSQGEQFAFITCLDVRKDKAYTKQDIRQYWGKYSHTEPDISIKEILRVGGKWSKFE